MIFCNMNVNISQIKWEKSLYWLHPATEYLCMM